MFALRENHGRFETPEPELQILGLDGVMPQGLARPTEQISGHVIQKPAPALDPIHRALAQTLMQLTELMLALG